MGNDRRDSGPDEVAGCFIDPGSGTPGVLVVPAADAADASDADGAALVATVALLGVLAGAEPVEESLQPPTTTSAVVAVATASRRVSSRVTRSG